MNAQETSESQLVDRLRRLEDKLDIYNIIAAHPPIVDTGSGQFVENFWATDGVFDSKTRKVNGSAEMVAAMAGGGVRSAVRAGLGHFCGLPYVAVQGDTAHAVSYLQLLGPDGAREQVEVANHAKSSGYRIHNVFANRWDFVRTADGWRIKRRTLRAIDGSEEALSILRGAFDALTPTGLTT